MRNIFIVIALILLTSFPSMAQNIEGSSARSIQVQRNYIKDGNAELYTRGISTYNDGAVSRPVDGTGGTPTITAATVSTTAPLEGVKSFVLTHPAANVQGQGWSIPFTIDSKDKAKVLDINMEYLVGSGTFTAGSSGVDSDLIIYIYDVTNALLIEPSSIKLLSNSSTLTDTFRASFQTASNSTSYRLIIHNATTSSTAFTIKTELAVSPSKYVYGTPITDWVDYTPTGSWVTNTTYTGKYRRVGSNGEFQVKALTSGAPTATAFTTTLPFTIDTAKLIDGSTAFEAVGSGAANDSGTPYKIYATPSGSSAVAARFQSATSGSASQVTATSLFTFGNTDYLTLEFSVPIAGWSSSVQVSDQADTRAVSFKATRTSSQTGVNPNNSEVLVALDVIDHDTHGSFNTSTNMYTVPVSGYYVFHGSVATLNTNVLNSRYDVRIYKNTSFIQSQGPNPVLSAGVAEILSTSTGPILCNAGDIIELRYFGAGNNSGSTLTIQGTPQATYLSGSRVSGPSAIAATESVNARYTSSSGQSIPDSTSTIVNFANQVLDSHAATTTGVSWRYTAPARGVYSVSAKVEITTGGGWASTEEVLLSLFKNGSLETDLAREMQHAVHTTRAGTGGSTLVSLNAGDYIDVRVFQNSGAAVSLIAAGNANHVSIFRVGN